MSGRASAVGPSGASSNWLVTAPGRNTARMAALTLSLEAFLLFFATLVAYRLADLPGSVVWGVGLVLVVACLLTCGLVRRPGGMAIGGVLQVLMLLTGIVVPAMWGMGAIFVVLWVWLAWIGQKMDGSPRSS